MREAERAGVSISLETMKGVLRGQTQSMAKLRTMIRDRTGKDARFMPNADRFTPSLSDKNAIDIGEPAWIQRFQTLMHKEDNGSLTTREDDEIDLLHKKLDAEYPGGSKTFLKRYERTSAGG